MSVLEFTEITEKEMKKRQGPECQNLKGEIEKHKRAMTCLKQETEKNIRESVRGSKRADFG